MELFIRNPLLWSFFFKIHFFLCLSIVKVVHPTFPSVHSCVYLSLIYPSIHLSDPSSFYPSCSCPSTCPPGLSTNMLWSYSRSRPQELMRQCKVKRLFFSSHFRGKIRVGFRVRLGIEVKLGLWVWLRLGGRLGLGVRLGLGCPIVHPPVTSVPLSVHFS